MVNSKWPDGHSTHPTFGSFETIQSSKAFPARRFKVSASSLRVGLPLGFGYGGGADSIRALLAASSRDIPVGNLMVGGGFEVVRIVDGAGRFGCLISPIEAAGEVRSLLDCA